MHQHLFGEEKVASVKEKVQFIQKFLKEHSLKILLWAVDLAKSSYYEFIHRKESINSMNMKRRRQAIEKIFFDNNGIYGARKITHILKQQGFSVSVRTVSHDLKALNLLSCYRKKYNPKSTISSNENCVNHMKSAVITKPLQYISTDISYICTTKDKWVYLLTFLDIYTRKVLHFDVSRNMDSSFVDKNTETFLKKYPKVKILHSDRGSQFTAHSYRKILEHLGVTASYSAKGYPYENAFIESYHAALKIESIYRLKIRDLEHAFKVVFQYNYGFYNSRRVHQSLDYKTPNVFEKLALVG